jgi:hypothetical protein
MFESAIAELNEILNRHNWVAELAGILPLSALIDFIDIPPKFHVFELAGAAPLWSWPVTPAGSRLLLSEDRNPLQACYLDRYGNSISLQASDGRYGDRYFIASPETVRLCLSSQHARTIENDHGNMFEDGKRTQNLEVVYVSRFPNAADHVVSSSWLRYVFYDTLWMHSLIYLVTSFFGWIFWAGMAIMTGILQAWISLAFLALMPMTGIIVFILFGSRPRTLLSEKPSRYNRLVLVSKHENSTDWIAFYGESSIVNSLLNRQLEPKGPMKFRDRQYLLRLLLRAFILAQWATALGAAATKDWNAYFICFWVAFCIFVHSYILTPERAAKDWLNSTAKVQIERYKMQVSSRRALLNTIISLNPDTFAANDRTKFYHGGMKWIDPILKSSPERSKWEEATFEAMVEVSSNMLDANLISENYRGMDKIILSGEWNKKYEGDYWRRFIGEGIYMAAKIKQEAKLPGATVPIKDGGL